MNIFLPFKRFDECAKALDDRRLIKQILECKQIVNMTLQKKENPDYKNPYLHHPVIMNYFYQQHHIVEYALAMCREYRYRFNKIHTFHSYFIDKMVRQTCDFAPIYVEGSKHSADAIREKDYDKVCELFKKKLCKKWTNDIQKGLSLNWTNRSVPSFYFTFTF